MKELLDRYCFSYEEEPKEEDDKAACATCDHYDEGLCGLFQKLNTTMPECFELTEVVSHDGLCRAFAPMGKSFKTMKRKADMRRKELNSKDESKEMEEEGEEE